MGAWQEVKQLAALQHARGFGTGVRNAGFNLADQLTQPVLLTAAVPILSTRLGFDQFGIWMLVLALTGSLSVFNLGLGDTTIKYVSKYRGSKDAVGIVRVFRTNLTMSAILGVLAACAFLIAAPLLARRVFNASPQNYRIVIRAIDLAGLLLALRSVESVLSNSLRAFEEYPAAAKVSVFVKLGIIGCAVLLAALGYGVLAILVATTIWVLLGLLVYSALVRQVVSGVSFWPTLDYGAWREVSSFGFYSWLQSGAALLFSNVDKLLVGALLGTTAVAYYAICVQLSSIVHVLPTAAFSFLFPRASHDNAAGQKSRLWSIFRLAIVVNLFAVVMLSLALVAGGKLILACWMGMDFAVRSYYLLAILTVGYALLAINVVPHFALLGLGKARLVCVTNLIAGTLCIGGVAALVPVTGLIGAGLGRLLYGLTLTLCYLQATKILRCSDKLAVAATTRGRYS